MVPTWGLTLLQGAVSVNDGKMLNMPARFVLAALRDSMYRSVRLASLLAAALADQREEVLAAFSVAGLYPGQQGERDGWLVVEFTPAQSCEGR